MILRRLKVNIGVFLILFLAVVLCYGLAYTAGFVTDFTGLYSKLEQGNLLGALDSFGFPSLMPVLNIFYLALFKIFGIHPIPWFLSASLFYTITLYALFLLIRQITQDYQVKHGVWITISALGILLVHPFSVEAMIWKVGLGHLISVAFFMLALVFFRRSATQNRPLFWMMLCLFLSIFSFEWALLFPAFVIVFMIIEKKWDAYRPALLLSVLLCILYLLLNKFLLGSFIGHYDINSESIKVSKSLSTSYKYLLKHGLLVHTYPSEIKKAIYYAVDKPIVSYLILLVGVVVFFVSRFRLSWLFGFAILAWICTMLVSPLHFNTSLSENSRYGSLMAPFIASFLSFLFFKLGRWVGIGLTIIFIGYSFYHQQDLVKQWKHSQSVLEVFMQSDICKNSPTLLLNAPDNMNGIFMLRDYDNPNPLREYFGMNNKPCSKLDLVGQYNIKRAEDAFSAEWLDHGIVKLSFNQWGNWWWLKGRGAPNYEAEFYIAKFKDQSIEISLKPNHPYERIYYFDGKELLELIDPH